MTCVFTGQQTDNAQYVRQLLAQKQPGFSAALELAVELVRRELMAPEMLCGPNGGFARDFGTADGERVMVAALTGQQFADLAKTTMLARTFAFMERLLQSDFSAPADLYTHQAVIALLLKPWFSRRTVADVAAAFAGTCVPWAPAPERPAPGRC